MIEIKFNKKGQGHIEMILSFVIFVGFLIFIFMFLNPFSSKTEPVPVERVQKIVVNVMSLEIGRLSAITDSTSDCYSLDAVNYGDDFVEIQNVNNPKKYDIYFNEIFGPGVISCSTVPNLNYTLGMYSKENMIIHENVEDLKTDYESGYSSLKSSLGLRNDFSFSFRVIGGNVVEELSVDKNPSAGVNVYAKEFPVKVIDSKGEIRGLIMNLRVW